MKNLAKKLIATIFAAVMVLSMTVSAFAAGADKDASLSVKRVAGTQATFTAYRVLDAKYEGDVQSGADAGKAVYSYTINPAFNNFFGNDTYGGFKFENGMLKTKDGTKIDTDGMSNVKDTNAARLASMLEKFVNDNNVSGTDVTDNAQSLPKGFYVISETLTKKDEENGFVASKPMLVSLTDDRLDIAPKADKITLDKKIGDNESSKPALDDDAQYSLEANNKNIGDTINYRVESKIPVYKTDADKTIDTSKLRYTFTDTFTGVKFVETSMIVKIDGNKITSGYTLTPAPNGKSFTLALDAATILANQGKKIDLYYEGILDTDAKVSSADGNPNKVVLEYSNNPNKADSYDTLKDEVKTFTYKFKIHKVDKDNIQEDLDGAEFTVTDANGKEIGSYKYEGDKIVASGKVVTADGGFAELTGLDEGVYTITETKAPAGYTLIASPVKVQITDEGGATPTGKATIKVIEGSGGAATIETPKDGQIDLVVQIKDSKGIALPETGAMSALYCMAGGVILLALGGMFLVFARRVKR